MNIIYQHSNRKHKLIVTLLVCVLCIAIVSTVICWVNVGYTKRYIFNYVGENIDSLDKYISQIVFVEKPARLEDYSDKWTVDCFSDKGMVQFLVRSYGFVTNGTYEGFYYSRSGEPLGFQGTDMPLQQNENGWSYKNNGHEYYTECISSNWYWYKMSF